MCIRDRLQPARVLPVSLPLRIGHLLVELLYSLALISDRLSLLLHPLDVLIDRILIIDLGFAVYIFRSKVATGQRLQYRRGGLKGLGTQLFNQLVGLIGLQLNLCDLLFDLFAFLGCDRTLFHGDICQLVGE